MVCASLTDLLGKSVVMVVAHPDDETLWGGGIILRFPSKTWTVICCSVPFTESVNAEKFPEACARLGASPKLVKVSSPGKAEPFTHLSTVDLSGFDAVVTHNEKGEYGHPHHTQVSRHVRAVFEGPIVFFGYGATPEHPIEINLDEEETATKLHALKAYDHLKHYEGRTRPKWEALLRRYYTDKGLKLGGETYYV